MANFYSSPLIGSNQTSTDPSLHGQMGQARQSVADAKSVGNGLQAALAEMSPGVALGSVFTDAGTRRTPASAPAVEEPD